LLFASLEQPIPVRFYNFRRKHEIADPEEQMLWLAAWRAVQGQCTPSQQKCRHACAPGGPPGARTEILTAGEDIDLALVTIFGI
jgi:hypothetical protein